VVEIFIYNEAWTYIQRGVAEMKKIVMIFCCLAICIVLFGCPKWKPGQPNPNGTTNGTNPPANTTNTTISPPTCTPVWLCNGSSKYYTNADCTLTGQEVCPFGCDGGACLSAPNTSNNTGGNDSCANGVCVTPTVIDYCSETDGGRNYTTAGILNHSRYSGDVLDANDMLSDYCFNTSVVQEYYCTGNKTIESELFECTYACIDGACTLTTPCTPAWLCNGSTAYYRKIDCSTANQTDCEFGCLDGVCEADHSSGGGDDNPPVNDTQPPVNETNPPANDTEPPVNDTGGGPQDQIDI
jgi:hypothetical protein